MGSTRLRTSLRTRASRLARHESRRLLLPLSLAIAGAGRSRAGAVALADVVGTALYLVLVHRAGRSLLSG